MTKIIGIDLGTTNSCVVVMEGKDAKVIENDEGKRTTPSIVAFNDKGEKLVGHAAERQAVINPENTFFAVKRLIGRKFTSKEVKSYKDKVAFSIISGKGGDAWVATKDGKKFSPPEISAAILQKMKETAERFLGTEVSKAVVTVPAYFDDAQRQATKDAGKIAGLDVKRIINEPTAAALAYGFDKKKEGLVAVYDLGGGTFDISILEIGDGVFEVKATNGDTFLGGEDFDRRVVNYLLYEFKKECGVDLTKDVSALQRLKEAAEKAKKELSSTQETEINLPYITADATGPKHMSIKLSRAKLESLVDDLIKNTIGPCKKALKDAKVKAADVAEVIMVGGMSRMPKVIEVVSAFFGAKPHQGVNPDEVVAIGAAIQGGVLQGDVKDVVLLDVTPLSLGIETMGGIFTRLIDRNSAIPSTKSQIFSTAEDNQPAVSIRIAQGERDMFNDNKLLGHFELTDLPPAPRGMPQIEVTFDINSDGIVTVTAKDKATNKEQSIQLKSDGGLSEKEIDQMVKDAQDNAESDKEKRELIEARNSAESLVNSSEKSLKEHGDKVSAEDKEALEQAIADTKEVLENEEASKEELDEKASTLMEASMKIGAAVYQASQADESEAKEGNADENKDEAEPEVVDADYKEI